MASFTQLATVLPAAFGLKFTPCCCTMTGTRSLAIVALRAASGPGPTRAGGTATGGAPSQSAEPELPLHSACRHHAGPRVP